jgi:hypothetical protein
MTTSESLKSSWKNFCRDLESAGDIVLESDLVGSELDRAEGLRYITRLLRIGLDMNLEHANADMPSFYQASHETAKIGADNPDNYYQNATISGGKTYRIWGERGSVPILSFATKANRYAIDGTMASTGEIDVRDMKIGDDGAFELIVSKTKPENGNWLPLEDDSSILIVRQTFFDKTCETPAKVYIENVNQHIPRPLTEERLQRALSATPAFVKGTAGTFAHWAQLFRDNNKNQLNTTDQSMFQKAGGDPMIYYLHGWWELGPGEALKISTNIPACEGWNFQLNNIWMESLDYRHHNIHINNESAELNPDGSVAIYVSAQDPENANWLETAGHSRGTMLFRWTGAKTHPIPTCEVIRL